jgi:anti-sigma-K factor RskA
MELTKIEQLLEKYFEATSTVTEEKVLKTYFSKNDVPPHLKVYEPIFAQLIKAKNETFTRRVLLKSKNNLFKWMSVAAAIALLFGIYFLQTKNETLETEYTQEEIASAQAALKLLAFNFEKGSQQISHLQEFEKNTNKFLK